MEHAYYVAKILRLWSQILCWHDSIAVYTRQNHKTRARNRITLDTAKLEAESRTLYDKLERSTTTVYEDARIKIEVTKK